LHFHVSIMAMPFSPKRRLNRHRRLGFTKLVNSQSGTLQKYCMYRFSFTCFTTSWSLKERMRERISKATMTLSGFPMRPLSLAVKFSQLGDNSLPGDHLA
jgi:hypothetical protein